MTPENIQRGSVLQSLRGLMPIRNGITFGESLRIAEIQASRLLSLLDVEEFPVSDEVVAGLPRIQIEYVPDLPTFGLSFWNGQSWIIQLSTRQSRARQRFTLFHEYKHIVDHGSQERLYHGGWRSSREAHGELVADYFAGCTLVPRRALKREWGNGRQRPAELAEYFDVSQQAIEVRLDQTGLREPLRRGTPAASGLWRLRPDLRPWSAA